MEHPFKRRRLDTGGNHSDENQQSSFGSTTIDHSHVWISQSRQHFTAIGDAESITILRLLFKYLLNPDTVPAAERYPFPTVESKNLRSQTTTWVANTQHNSVIDLQADDSTADQEFDQNDAFQNQAFNQADREPNEIQMDSPSREVCFGMVNYMFALSAKANTSRLILFQFFWSKALLY
jgi:hypothetical protein